MPIESKPEDIIYVPIQNKLEKNPSQANSSKHKSKKEKEPDMKKVASSPEHSKPVTIAYYTNTKAVKKNEQTKSMHHHGSASGSPPYQQNPLEPKLAAGPASGYPQQYN